ncbi:MULTISPECIES: hypothetical protein [Pseudomonas]|uniref:hypothetical protein n=1 Tax=Pseudomonas TaxID=286 RepID=UPI001AE25A8B|nr:MULTISPECIES: hypothetical protein [unclassified Pseudomonas]MBP1126710.1 hypothetical protein [Pseudomonas sp. PvP025]MDQ0400570.1 hypothetical protein [Pseudomonas sp. PvP006]
MSRLPPVGVLTCIRQVLSSLHLFLAKHRAPANILDARVFLFFASSIAITPQMTAAPIKNYAQGWPEECNVAANGR